ncbi:hypothetical protein KA977_04055 [Candidatus Dependentiae bacterium]|nr:hypothetical protein [Candidatus Dependentiae bacterium]
MDYDKLPDSKKPFFIRAKDGGMLMNLNLVRFYSKVDGRKFIILGLEMDVLEEKEFATEDAALEYDKQFWLNLSNVNYYNNKYLCLTYSNAINKYKMLLMQLQEGLKHFYNENKGNGYFFQ